MQFLLFSVLFLDVFGVSAKTSPAMVLKQSANFLSSLATADPEVINKMIGLVTDLEKQGQDEKNDLIAKASAQAQVEEQKKREHDVTEKELKDAQEHFAADTANVNSLTAEELTKRALLEAATLKRDGAQKHADETKASMISITNRVAEEKKAFAQVLELLDSVVVPKNLLTIGRSLLGSDAADPDAVAAVKAQVVDLDKAADQEAADAIAADTDAQDKLATAKSEYSAASDTHTAVAGALKEAQEDLDAARIDRDNKITAERVAREIEHTEHLKTVELNSFRDLEVERINEEAKALAETKKLLKTLL